MKKLSHYDVVITEDGTPTLFSQKYNEACHSLSGARSETYYNYFLMAGVLDNHTNIPFNILEVGFGLGLGYLVVIEEIIKLNSKWAGTFYSLEIDPFLIEYAKDTCDFSGVCPYPTYKDLEVVFKHHDLTVYEANKNNVTLKILVGDATKTLDIAMSEEIIPIRSIHCIFQDAFSPKGNPELWTLEWFMRLKNLASNKAVLSTYSASHSVRENLKNAGFLVENHKGFGPKRSMTRATTS